MTFYVNGALMVDVAWLWLSALGALGVGMLLGYRAGLYSAADDVKTADATLVRAMKLFAEIERIADEAKKRNEQTVQNADRIMELLGSTGAGGKS
jgi:hypothetical protein